MKKVIISFFTGLCFLSAFAQYNTELIDTTKIWSTVDTYTGGGGIMYSFFTKFSSDTVINNLTYTKFLRAYDEYMTEWELQGFIRQDGNKFFFRNLIGEEGLAYDFNSNVGDTLNINNPFGFYTFQAIVIEIDSLYIEPANEYRKRIQLEFLEYSYYGIESWIEGIGSNAGLIVSGCKMAQLTGGPTYSLLCYFEDDELIYKNQYFDICYFPLVSVQENPEENLQISINPNPVTTVSNLSIKSGKNKNLPIVIFNTTGEQVEKFIILSPVNIKINSEKYGRGLFFYSVIENSEPVHTGKFIIQ